MAAGCVVNSTRSMVNTICSGTVTLTVSPLIAAAFNSASTCCHVDLARVSAGRCFSISFRTSASVRSVMTPGMTRDLGNVRDQLGRGRENSYATQEHHMWRVLEWTQRCGVIGTGYVYRGCPCRFRQ